MTIIADASSLILLAKITILERLLEKNDIIIPEKVYIEIIKGKEKGRFDALIIEKLVQDKKIKIEKVDKEMFEKIWKLFGLWAGEGEAFVLALKNKFPILTDDRKCINASKSANIPFITSPVIIVALFNKKSINKNKAEKSLELLEEYGWYNKNIIKFYKEKIK